MTSSGTNKRWRDEARSRMADSVMASVDAHRKRVTGGILFNSADKENDISSRAVGTERGSGQRLAEEWEESVRTTSV